MNLPNIEKYLKGNSGIRDYYHTGPAQRAAVEYLIAAIAEECASIAYNSSDEGEVIAQEILYKFNVDNCRARK